MTCHACGKRGHYANNCCSRNQNARSPSRSRSNSQSSRASTRPSVPGLVNPTPNFNSNFNQSFTPSDSSTNFNSKKRKVDTVHLLQQSAIYFDLMVNGKWVQAIVDTGALVCVVGAHLVDPSQISRKSAVPIQVANGAQVFSLGTTELTLNLNGNLVRHPALVMETPAFDAVLGFDFLSTPPCRGLITIPDPCLLMCDGQMVPLTRVQHKKGSLYRIFKVTKVFRSKS